MTNARWTQSEKEGVPASLVLLCLLLLAGGMLIALSILGEPMAEYPFEPSVTVGTGAGTEVSAEHEDNPLNCGQVVTEQHRGMCFAHNWQHNGSRGYGTDASQGSLEELANIGVDWVSLTPFGYQRGLSSTDVQRIDVPAAETDERLREAISQAHALGIRVMMKPHIWISYSAWRGDITFADETGWDAWFESYTAFILHYAELSEELGADMFVVGVEFRSSTPTHADAWREVIAAVREVYSGPITYAANWDEVSTVTFWDALDYIGVQMFAPLASSSTPTREELVSVADTYLRTYVAVSETFGRPLLLTEVGFKAIEGTAMYPWGWPEHLPEGYTGADQVAQSDAYCAIIQTFGQSDAVAGIYWWKWFTDVDTDEEGLNGFSPRGKQAEEVLRFAF